MPQFKPSFKPQLKRFLLFVLFILSNSAWAVIDPALIQSLTTGDFDARMDAIAKLGIDGTPETQALLTALKDEKLYTTPKGRLLIVEDDKATDVASGEKLAVPEDAESITVNNSMQQQIDVALAGIQLSSPDTNVRVEAARQIQNNGTPAQLPVLEKAIAREGDAQVKSLLSMAIANLNLKSPDAAVRKKAVETLAESTDASIRPVLAAMLEKNEDVNGETTAETDPAVRAAIGTTLNALDARQARIEWFGNIFYGISLASVLLLAALGLAITFGLMGIINMAHGELLMIGAYATYMVQSAFRNWLPVYIDWYVIVAIPVAFMVAAGVGMVMERTVIRWLYGRPLETLLATWGISLILMQLVRSIFGSNNVEIANPSWMSGGITVLGGLVLTWNRMFIIAFALMVVLLVWVLLNKTRLGLFVRAVTQNRRMASCVGVPTGRVDMLTFGLGSGIAGLGGVALSQLTNVGPGMGQDYIVDSFMVVVFGGVGQLAGTISAAFGLGVLNKILEPSIGAVLAKIAILVIIVLFIQKRPQGLFALKGRSLD